MKKTMLLGAGFSYELGMPLAKGVTSDFYSYLSPRRLKSLIHTLSQQQPYGKDRPIDPKTFVVIETTFERARKNFDNYEKLMRELSGSSNGVRSQPELDTFSYFNTVLKDIVSHILWIHQENKLGVYETFKQRYSLLREFLEDEDVFVFTLNHDICLEMLCLDFSIPFSFGTKDKVHFLRSNVAPAEKLTFERQERTSIKSIASSFLHSGPSPALNIVKLHGAFNEYGYEDKADLLFVDHSNSRNSQEYFTRVKRAWLETEHIVNGTNVKMSEFIPVTDDTGDFQILAKTLLIGGSKFSPTIDPKPGEEKLALLDEVLLQSEELTILGYGFNDKYLNSRIYNSMILNRNLKIRRVDPANLPYPEQFDAVNYGLRLTGGICSTTEWLHYRKHQNWNSELSDEAKKFSLGREEKEARFRKKHFG